MHSPAMDDVQTPEQAARPKRQEGEGPVQLQPPGLQWTAFRAELSGPNQEIMERQPQHARTPHAEAGDIYQQAAPAAELRGRNGALAPNHDAAPIDRQPCSASKAQAFAL